MTIELKSAALFVILADAFRPGAVLRLDLPNRVSGNLMKALRPICMQVWGTAFLLMQSMIGCVHAQTYTSFHSDKARVASEYRDATLGLDASKPMQWNFFFSAKDRRQFAAVVAALKTKHYFVVTESEEAKGNYFLHLARIEVLTPDSLQQRNEALFDLAKSEGITFEGWSVFR